MKLHQLLEVLLGQPRVAVALLLELVARRLGHDGHFLRFETAVGLRRRAAGRRCRGGVQEPRRLPAEQEAAADASASIEQQLQHRPPTHVLK